MRTLALFHFFWRDHFRTSAVILEIIAVLSFLFIILDRRYIPYEPSYIALNTSIMAVFLSALCTSLVVRRNADQKIDLLILKTGRIKYLVGILITSFFLTTFWLAVVFSYVYFFIPLTGNFPNLNNLIIVTIINLLLICTLFTLFSSLTGGIKEIYLAFVIALMGLCTPFFFRLGPPWDKIPWDKILIIFPPLNENITSLSADVAPPVVQSLVYTAVLLALGIIRIKRREFFQS